jgi:hypothetical protein
MRLNDYVRDQAKKRTLACCILKKRNEEKEEEGPKPKDFGRLFRRLIWFVVLGFKLFCL